MSANSVCTTDLSRTTRRTRRRACKSPRFANVTNRSASGRSRFAFASVVVIRPCSKSAVAKLPRISRSCEGPPPKRGPLVGVGISSPQVTFCRAIFVWSELFVLSEALTFVVVLDAVVRDHAGVEPGRAVLEREAHAGELGLHLVDRLLPEVADVEQVRLTAADELAHGVNAFALQAVVRPHGQLEVLDEQRQVGGKRGIRRRRADVDALGV